jgi:hypothetical protein
MSWYDSIYKGLIIGGITSFIISYFTSDATSYNSLICGYAIIMIGVLMILTLIISKNLDAQGNNTEMQIFLSLISISGPFLFILMVLGFIFFILSVYKTHILGGQVSSSYNTFSNITLLLIMIQIYIIYTNIDNPIFKNSGNLSSTSKNVLYLIGVSTLFTTGTMYIILKYFTTDGFQMLQNSKYREPFRYSQ